MVRARWPVEPADRYDTALAMAEAIEAATPPATTRAVGQWLRELAGDRLDARAHLVAAIEGSGATPPRPATPGTEALPTLVDETERAHTGVSVAADREKAPPPRRASWAWVAVGGIAIGGGIATAAVVGRAPPAAPTVTSASAAPAPSPASSVPPEPAASAPSPPLPAPPPIVAASAAGPPSASAASKPAPRPARPRPAPTAAPAGSGLYGRE